MCAHTAAENKSVKKSKSAGALCSSQAFFPVIKSAKAVLAPGPSMKKGLIDQTLISQKKMLAKPEQFSSPVYLTATQAALSV